MASNERAIINNLNERARFYGGPDAAQLTIYDVRAVLQFFDRKSCKSGEPATSLDHVNPLSLGGENVVENLQVLTTSENKGKGDTEIDYRKGRICTREFVDEFMTEHGQNKETYKKHDWDLMEFEFISTDLSTRKLAEKHNVSYGQLSGICTRENWVRKRELFRGKLGADAVEAALEEEIDLRLEISRTTLDFLKLWRRQANKIGNQDLIKILELGAKANGLDIDRRTLTVKDWRDTAGTDVDDIQRYATEQADNYFEGDTGDDYSTGA